MTETKKGFAGMDPEKQRQIAKQGGASVDAKNRSFSKNKDLAREAGRKGGKSVNPKNRYFSRPGVAAEMGKIGGRKRSQTAAKQEEA